MFYIQLKKIPIELLKKMLSQTNINYHNKGKMIRNWCTRKWLLKMISLYYYDNKPYILLCVAATIIAAYE